MSDIDEIRQLTTRYNHARDALDTAAWLECWTEDGIYEREDVGQRLAGHEELASLFSGGAPAGRHVTSEHLIEVNGDTATQRCYLQYLDPANGHAVALFAIYEDELVRQDGRWRFRARRIRPEK